MFQKKDQKGPFLLLSQINEKLLCDRKEESNEILQTEDQVTIIFWGSFAIKLKMALSYFLPVFDVIFFCGCAQNKPGSMKSTVTTYPCAD